MEIESNVGDNVPYHKLNDIGQTILVENVYEFRERESINKR